MLRTQKADLIAELEEDLRASPALIVTDYRGLPVSRLSAVRNDLRALDATFRVSKNTLARIAAERTETEGLAPLLKGPTAIAFCRSDPAPVAKRLADVARETRVLTLRGAVLDGRTYDEEGVRALATLPPREQLYAQVVGGIAAPLSSFVSVLNAVPRGLVVALDQIRQQREEGAAA
jgi:large subunit ribosomal protein L10